MKRQFVIECDSESAYVHVYEVERYFTDKVNYSREAGTGNLICGKVDPKFYGRLNALLFSAETISKAEPIVPEEVPSEAIS